MEWETDIVPVVTLSENQILKATEENVGLGWNQCVTLLKLGSFINIYCSKKSRDIGPNPNYYFGWSTCLILESYTILLGLWHDHQSTPIFRSYFCLHVPNCLELCTSLTLWFGTDNKSKLVTIWTKSNIDIFIDLHNKERTLPKRNWKGKVQIMHPL